MSPDSSMEWKASSGFPLRRALYKPFMSKFRQKKVFGMTILCIGLARPWQLGSLTIVLGGSVQLPVR